MFHSSTGAKDSKTLETRYQRLVQNGDIQQDTGQRHVLERLGRISNLVEKYEGVDDEGMKNTSTMESQQPQEKVPRGLYIYGPVGMCVGVSSFDL